MPPFAGSFRRSGDRHRRIPACCEALAGSGALVANFSAFAADVPLVLGAEMHEMRCRATDIGACHDQREMLLCRVLAADLQAVPHGGRKTYLVVAQAIVDAAFHVRVDVVHGCSPCLDGGARLILRWHQSTG